MAPWLYVICGSLMVLLWLRRERYIFTVLIGFDIGMGIRVAQLQEFEWIGYIIAINGLGVVCLVLAQAEARFKRKLEDGVLARLAEQERVRQEQQELDAEIEALEQRLGVQKELYQSAQSLASVISLDSFLQEVRAVVARLFSYETAWLVRFEADGGASVRDLRQGDIAGLGPFSEDFCQHLRENADVLFGTDHADADNRDARPAGDGTWVAVPLIHQGQVWGSIVWVGVEPVAPRGGRDMMQQIEMLRNLQHQFALALSRVLLYQEAERLSRTDPLTDMSKRWYFMQRLGEEMDRCRRRGDSLSLIMVDVDHFKQINDRFGHLVGDRALREVASLMRSKLRLGDLACRYGGEEFLLALPATKEALAGQVAERVREAVAAFEINADGGKAEVTVSLGVAEISSRDERIEDAINRADHMLYRAKWLGRNRTCLYSKEAKDDGAAAGV